MPTTVTIPNVGDVDFPDSMSPADIQTASHRLYLQTAANAPKLNTTPQAPGLTDNAQAFGPSGVITPQNGESFQQTMQRAATAGKTVTPEEVTGQTIQGAKDAPLVLASAPAIGAGGAAALTGVGEGGGALYDLAIKHLAGNVLPGLEETAAREKLLEYAPKVAKAAKELGIAGGGIGLLWKAVFGGGKH